MQEIRLHGRGGQGTVKAAEIMVYAAVWGGKFANSIPHFGFERQGAPVSAFVRIDDKHIRPKTQIYAPDCVVVMDETVINAVNVFEGMKAGSILVINSKREPASLKVPREVSKVAAIDATGLALEMLGANKPNTAMLGAFVAATGFLDLNLVKEQTARIFDASNAEVVQRAYQSVKLLELGGERIGYAG